MPVRLELNLGSRRGRPLIERPRVSQRLLEAAEYPIVLITAPAGFGKTTSIKQFLALCEDPIYVSLPSSAKTLDGFIHAFAQGCRTRIPAMSSSPPALLEKPLSLEEELDLYTAWAVANLKSLSCTIAIDDLQYTDDDPRVVAFLNRITERCGDQIQWLFASRTQGLLPRAQWQAYARADATITADDLRMNEAEAFAFADAIDSSATREQLSNWVRLTQGFPVPLTYAIRASSRRGNLDDLIKSMRSLTFRFLAEHLWQALPRDDRALLEIAAFAPPVHVGCFELCGVGNAISRLASLSDDIAFISLDSDLTFSMHDLFRDFVRQQVLLRGTAAYTEVTLQAVALLLSSRRYPDAVQLLVEIEDLPALLNTIESSPVPFDNLEILPKVIAVVERAPAQNLTPTALLLLTNYWMSRGVAKQAIHYAEAILLRPESKSNQLLGAIRAVSRFTHFSSAESQKAWLDRIPAIVDRLEKPDHTEALAYQANYCARFPEKMSDAQSLLRGVQYDLPHLEQQTRFNVLMVNASSYVWLDDEVSALESVREAVNVAETIGDPREMTKALNTLGILLYQRCDPEFEVISNTQRALVTTQGAWRYSLASHWLPSEYYARSGDVNQSKEIAAIFNDVILSDEDQRQTLLYFRRISSILTNLIEGKYKAILDDFARLGRAAPLPGQYEITLASAFAHAFLGDETRAAGFLIEANALREKLTTAWDRGRVFDVYYGEVIVLCLLRRWSQAKRLMRRYGEESARTPAFYKALLLLCDGPPFVGVKSLLLSFVGKPYVGMLALLATRVIENCSAAQNDPFLTPAEAEVLRLIGIGKSNKAIADARSRSTETVKRQVTSLFRKLGVDNRTSAVAVGRERGLL